MRKTHLVCGFIAGALSLSSFVSSAQSVSSESSTETSAAVVFEKPEVVVFSENEVTSSISAISQLIELSEDVNIAGMVNGELSEFGAALEGLRASRKASKIIQQTGMSLERFQSVTYSLAMAVAALDIDVEGLRVDRDEQEAMLQQMKAFLPAGQYEMARQQIEGAAMMMKDVANQPKSNIALAAKYRAQFEALTE